MNWYIDKKWSLKLSTLKNICIETTDVDDGLEFLPLEIKRLVEMDCRPNNTNANCKVIQDQLRPFNYDIEAWQLANPEKMLISRPELFTNPDSKDKWIEALDKKSGGNKERIMNDHTKWTW